MTRLDDWFDERSRLARERNLRERGVPWSAADDWFLDHGLTLIIAVAAIAIVAMILVGVLH